MAAPAAAAAAPLAVTAASCAFSYKPPAQAFLRGTVKVMASAASGGVSTVYFKLTWASTCEWVVTSDARYDGSLPPGAALPANAAAQVREAELRGRVCPNSLL